MKLKHITHVFFDLDHTLWDFDKNSALTFEKIFELNQLSIHLQDFITVYEPINLKYWQLYRNEQIDKTNLRFGRLNDAFNALGIELEPERIHKLAHDYITYLATFNHLFEDTISILQYLKENYNLHIITNGFKEVQHQKLENSGILSYFQTVTNSEMVGVKKPNPKIFEHALHSAQAKTQNSIMIGDNLEADVYGALHVGLDAIFFNYRNENIQQEIKEVKNLSALKKYL
ncbi:MAG TPA: YjjG family noncanonical pyrimidine nucleotidase [Flavobacteriaceae bacterium]|nr:YjjG family noncanonical pyrimidine nucleotidase [Flavobacteriaceae bacterium]